MKIQVTNTRTGERAVVSGTDEQVEARLRLMYPGATSHVPDGYLGNVVQAAGRVEHVVIQSLEGALPAATRSVPALE